MSAHELKSLQTQLAKARFDRQEACNALTLAQANAHATKVRVQELERRIAEMIEKSKEPVVTEHALLRYMERVYGFDLEEIRKKILTPATIKAIKVIGSGTFPLEAGGRAVVKGNAIVSITE